VSVKRRTRRRQRQQKKTRRLSVRRKQNGGESSVDIPGGIVIERDAGDKYSPFLAVERDTARNELSASSV